MARPKSPSQGQPPEPADQAPQFDPARLDQAANQLHQELQAHGTAPGGAAAAPPGAAAGILGNLIAKFHLSDADIAALKGLGMEGLKLALKIALAGGLSL